MIGFIGRRLLELLPVVLIASMAIFGMIHAIPGGPVAGMSANDTRADRRGRAGSASTVRSAIRRLAGPRRHR
jgi:ABC-type dipeptide/oligopeptide/nickel transport system permease component